MKITTCVYLIINDLYLMLYRNKKENDPNEGKYLGVGGHLIEGESVYDCALREFKEETNLTLLDLKLKGEVHFVNDKYEEYMYIFTSSAYEGEMSSCDEGELLWVKKEDLLSLNLWEGDKEIFKAMEKDYFKLRLRYQNDKLVAINYF